MAERVTAIAVNGKVSKFIDMGNSLQLIDYIYPVGSIFSSVDPDMDPNTRYVGTEWNRLEDGYFLEATATTSSVNTKVEAGLPNIVGQFVATFVKSVSGAFTGSAANHNWRGTTDTTQATIDVVGFNANNSNKIYGKSTTVQPKALRVAMWIRIK